MTEIEYIEKIHELTNLVQSHTAELNHQNNAVAKFIRDRSAFLSENKKSLINVIRALSETEINSLVTVRTAAANVAAADRATESAQARVRELEAENSALRKGFQLLSGIEFVEHEE